MGWRAPVGPCNRVSIIIGKSITSRTYSESASAPWAAATDVVKTSQKLERGLVAKRHIDDTVVGERAHRSKRSALLPTTLGASGDEHSTVLAPVRPTLPLPPGLIPKRLPLRREVAVSGWDAKEKSVVLLQGLRIRQDGDTVVLARGVHLGEHFLRESLLDLVEVGSAASLFNALQFGFGEGLDMAVHGVLGVVC